MASFSHSVAVNVHPERLWTLIRDVRWLAKLFPYITVDEMHSPEPGRWRFRRQLAIPHVADLRWCEETREVAEGQMQFRAVEGDLETFAGSWQVVPQNETALLMLAVEYDVPTHLANNLPAPMVNHVMGEIFRSICRRVKEVAEEGAA